MKNPLSAKSAQGICISLMQGRILSARNVGNGALAVPQNVLHIQRDAEGGVPYNICNIFLTFKYIF